MQFSNPRTKATFTDWPIGGSNRGNCEFFVETNNRGKRVGRRTTNKHGQWCNPKFTTYGKDAIIVDGDDSRTYVLQRNYSGFISVYRHDFLSADPSSIFGHDPDYAATMALFDQAQTV